MAYWEDLGLRGGIWQGIWHDDRAPKRVSLVHLGERVGGAELVPLRAASWRVSARLPADLLTEGVTTMMLVADSGSGEAPIAADAERLAALPIIAGTVLDEDLRAEITLMRAEMDLLKREIRRLAAAERSGS